MARGPYNELGSMLNRVAEKRKKQQAVQRAKSKLMDRTPGPITALNETGYISENGLDREDAQVRTADRRAFQAGVNAMITRNIMNGIRKGQVGKNYPLLEANKRSKTIPSKRRTGK